MLILSLLIASIFLFGLALFLTRAETSMRRWRRIPSTVVLTVGFALLTVTLIALLEHTFTSSFGRFPLRLLNPGASYWRFTSRTILQVPASDL